ncbi:recombinase family protein [Bacillaceae bacterium W0354]
MKAALYMRVSTAEQVENYSLESQKERLEAFCKSKGWTVYDRYIDGGFSGANTNRPALQQLLNDLDEIDVVVVYKLDRLSRSQRDTLDLIEEYFLKNDVEFVSITETLDTSTPFGKAMIGILSVFAQLERETIAERMRIGHKKRVEDGYRVSGGDYDPSGYKRENGKLITKTDEKEHIQLLFNLYEKYHSITKVQKEIKAKGLPVWRFNRYRNILSNRLYIGEVSFEGEYYPGKHEAFITKEQFERVQSLLKRHRGHNAHKAKRSLLSGLIKCGSCGEPYVTYTTSDKRNGRIYRYRYYICKARRFPSEFPKKCFNLTYRSENLESIVAAEIQHLNVEKNLTKMSDHLIKKEGFKRQIAKVDKKIERILGLYAEDLIDKKALNKKIEGLNEEKNLIIENQKEHDLINKHKLTEDDIKDYVITLKHSTFENKQAVYQKLIKNIVIHSSEEIEIEWNF